MENEIIVANKLRKLHSEKYNRFILKTHVVTDKDNIEDIVSNYAKQFIRDENDIIFLSEKMVACTQRRAIPINEIKPRKLATLLSNHVTKTEAGIGLGMPETMEMALQECGTLRILFAAGISVMGKMLHKKGWFYYVAGKKARGIDGPCSYTLPPYNHYVVLIPDDPDGVAKRLSGVANCKVAIIDANDLGIQILGVSDSNVKKEFLCELLGDNPLGQQDECTPMGIIRKVS
ncbi:ABC-type sugar transport system, periplasmic component [Lachnospiraceae bacterium KM106-2]|nr:ABC-type sugar transport system, periplasmic component [Lachnospiraceae bacterium KM106-2]